MIKNYRSLCLIIFGFALAYIYSNAISHYRENQLFEKLINAKSYDLTKHENIVKLRNNILHDYVNTFKSEKQLNIWQAYRTILRQSASETIMGKLALCGEFTRVMVKLLRANNIPARRLYLFGAPGSSHVLFEYYNKLDNEWYVVNSFASIVYVNQVFDHKKITKDTLFDMVDDAKFKYKEITTLNYQLRNIFPGDFELPYFLSVLLDEPFLIKIILFSLLLFSALVCLVYKSDPRE